MESLSSIYRTSFFKSRWRLAWRAPIVCEAVLNALHPKSVIDVGCAIGDIVKGFIDLGIESMGMEGTENCVPFLQIPRENLIVHDLRVPLTRGRRFDVATCFEVAEHIEPEFADTLVHNLTELSDNILLSIAPPGQGGHHHVNCQFYEYWQEKFAELGYKENLDVVGNIRYDLKRVQKKPGVLAIYRNLAFFELARSVDIESGQTREGVPLV